MNDCQPRLAKTEERQRSKLEIVLFNFKEAFRMFSDCLIEDNNVKPSAWREETLESAIKCWVEFKTGILEKEDSDAKTLILHGMLDVVRIPSIRSECCLDLSRFYFNISVCALANADFKKGLHALKDCYMPLSEARKHGCLVVEEECNILDEDVRLHTCIAESMQARSIGKFVSTHLV